MEHLLRLAHSNSTFYAAALLFTLGVILWLAWARFFHEREGLKAVPHFVMALSALVLFAGSYASVATNGLDGMVCATSRHSLHVTCYSHDEHPWMFWAVLVWQTCFRVGCALAALVFLARLVAPGATRRARHLPPANAVDVKPPAAQGAKPGGMVRAFGLAIGVIVISTLAWIATTLDQVNDVRTQVAEAFASVAFERGTVETYLQEHGALPEDNQAAKLLPSAELRRRDVSEVEVVKGSLLLTFDATTADEHLAGRHVLLIAVRDERQVHWHCATMDVDDKYLPVRCSAGL